MHTDLLTWLQEWYDRQARDGWEHRYGMRISTLDNPGWTVTIDLRQTAAEGKTFEPVNEERGERDWIYCWVEEEQFEGRGGPQNLAEILAVFRTWVEP
jgi:hypothetical protein